MSMGLCPTRARRAWEPQLLIPSTDVIQLTLTLKMTTAQVVETSVTVNNNMPIQDYVQPDGQTQPTFEMTPGLKPFTAKTILLFSTSINAILLYSYFIPAIKYTAPAINPPSLPPLFFCLFQYKTHRD